MLDKSNTEKIKQREQRRTDAITEDRDWFKNSLTEIESKMKE